MANEIIQETLSLADAAITTESIVNADGTLTVIARSAIAFSVLVYSVSGGSAISPLAQAEYEDRVWSYAVQHLDSMKAVQFQNHWQCVSVSGCVLRRVGTS